jgi:hypothetical protein
MRLIIGVKEDRLLRNHLWIFWMKTLFRKRILRLGTLWLLVVLPLRGLALQVEIVADKGVPEKTVQEIQAGIITVQNFYQEYYGLDIDYPINLVLASRQDIYLAAITTKFGIPHEDVEKYYLNTRGVTYGHTIITNLSLCPDNAWRLRHITHELTHQYQAALSGDAQQLRWLSEGVADIMAVIIVLNGWKGLSTYAQERMVDLRVAMYVPNLRQLRSGADWVKAADKSGLGMNYYTSDEAVIYLIGKVGFAPVFMYFRLLGKSENIEQAFADAFGISLADFEEEFRRYLSKNGINAG